MTACMGKQPSRLRRHGGQAPALGVIESFRGLENLRDHDRGRDWLRERVSAYRT